ncbi:MAG: TolC family protein [Bacteroidota bacterium]|nr:TolC family protein [Bacteroidota bacterium]
MKNNINRIITSALLVLYCGFLLSAQEKTLSLTIYEAKNFALENSTSILNARLDVLSAKKKVWETTAIGLPQVSATASYLNTFNVPEMNFGSYIDYDAMTPGMPITPEIIKQNMRMTDPIKLGVKENITADLLVNQLIFNGSYIVGLQASLTYKLLSEQGLEKTGLEVKELVGNSYFLCLIIDKNLKTLNKSIVNQEKISDDIKAMFEVGFVEENDVDQMYLLLNSLEIMKSKLERQKDLTYDLLRFQLGIDLDRELVLSTSLENYIDKLNFENLMENSFNTGANIDYQLINTQEKLSLLNVKNIKADFLPTISAFYKHQELLDEPEFNFVTPDMLGVNLSLPIFSSGQRLAKVSQAQIELDKISNNKRDLEKTLNIAFRQTKSQYITAFDNFGQEKKNMEVSEKIYNNTLAKYKEGMAGSLDLTQAQNQYLNSRSNYYNAMYELLSAKLSLEKLLGSQ